MQEEIKNNFKNEALALAEDVTAEMVEHVFKFSKNALTNSKNVYLMAIVPVLEQVEKYLLSLVDKIDGVEGNLEIKG